MRRIYYFSGATLPSQSAQSVHVMKMCGAIADRKEYGVTLFAKSDANISEEDIFQYYGVPGDFTLALSNNWKIPVLSGIWRVAGHSLLMGEAGKPDIAYSRDAIELNFLAPDKIPIVFEVHQMPGSWLERRAIKKLSQRQHFYMVVISEALKNDFIKFLPWLKKERVFVAPDGADLPQQTATPKELPGRSDVLKIGYTGSLHEGKGMEVIAVLAKECPDFDFHVVGGSEAQVKDWRGRNLPSNVTMHGHVPHGELGPYVAAFDILIAPYRTKAKIKSGRDIARWISPLKIFEYMAAGKPIIASDLPVIREVLRDGENAILVKPDDVKGWAKALESLKDPVLRKNLATQAYDDLVLKYSWKIRARNILKFVDKGI